MNALFDTHCHLFMEPLDERLAEVLERARSSGVSRFLVPGVSRVSWQRCASLAEGTGICCALGVHPWWADEGVDTDSLRRELLSSGARAVGEIGLDWKCSVDRETQLRVFTHQLELASSLSLPVILHCRAAFEDMLGILRNYHPAGTVHGWSAGPELMGRFLDMGLHISFGGAVTRTGARRARASAMAVPADRFLLETDAPAIGLEGVQAGDSEPAHLQLVLKAMAMVRDEDDETVAACSFRNSCLLFGE